MSELIYSKVSKPHEYIFKSKNDKAEHVTIKCSNHKNCGGNYIQN